MKFIYTEHFNFQIRERRITKELAKRIYLEAAERYFDTFTNHRVAILKVRFHEKARKVMVAYDIIGKDIHFITAYPLKEQEIMKKLAKNRWIYEKN